eukprot:g32939.t1
MAAKAPGQPEAFSSSRPVAYGSASHPPAYSTSAHPGFYNTASAPQAAAYTPASAPRPYPQPVAASYTTASTSTGPTFNVQVKVAQPVPSYTQPGRQAEQAYGPPPPRQVSPPYFQQHPEPAYRAPQHRYPELSYASVPEPPQASPNWYPPAHFGGSPSLPDTSYGPEGMYGNARKPEHSLYGGGSKLAGQPYQPPANKKGSYSEELPPPPPPPPPTTTSHHLKERSQVVGSFNHMGCGSGVTCGAERPNGFFRKPDEFLHKCEGGIQNLEQSLKIQAQA